MQPLCFLEHIPLLKGRMVCTFYLTHLELECQRALTLLLERNSGNRVSGKKKHRTPDPQAASVVWEYSLIWGRQTDLSIPSWKKWHTWKQIDLDCFKVTHYFLSVLSTDRNYFLIIKATSMLHLKGTFQNCYQLKIRHAYPNKDVITQKSEAQVFLHTKPEGRSVFLAVN